MAPPRHELEPARASSGVLPFGGNHPQETVFPPLAPTSSLHRHAPPPNPVEASPPAIPHPPGASSGRPHGNPPYPAMEIAVD